MPLPATSIPVHPAYGLSDATACATLLAAEQPLIHIVVPPSMIHLPAGRYAVSTGARAERLSCMRRTMFALFAVTFLVLSGVRAMTVRTAAEDPAHQSAPARSLNKVVRGR
jgi:hypothetical protein